MSVVGNIDTRQTSVPYTISAPVGGLNGRDPLADMPPQDAYLMDNVIPRANKVEARKGAVKHTESPCGCSVQTLEVYTGADGDVMLAWAGDTCYNVSTSTPAVLEDELLQPIVQTAMFSNAADNAQHLIIVNGEDLPRSFNGTSLSTRTMTGITNPRHLIDVTAFKSRLYFAAIDKLGFYYLPIGQIQGALSFFDLGQVSKLGGYLLTIATYSEGSAGETPNDYIIFITSKGECIVYNGTDPSDASAWSLVGRYYAAEPIGRKCAFNLNGELILLTLEGAIPFSLIRQAGDASTQGVAVSEFGAVTTKLGRYLSDLNVFRDVHGWQGIQYSRGGLLVLNVPSSSNGHFFHFAMNINTGAWGRFLDWNGICFAVFNSRLYFGRQDGHIMLADEGLNDDGEPIDINVKQAYNYFSSGNEIGNAVKHFRWAEIFLESQGTPPINGSLSVNFNEREPSYLNTDVDLSGAEWDTATWDVSGWAGTVGPRKALLTLNRGGFAGSLWLRASLDNVDFAWFATQYVMGRTTGLLI